MKKKISLESESLTLKCHLRHYLKNDIDDIKPADTKKNVKNFGNSNSKLLILFQMT